MSGPGYVGVWLIPTTAGIIMINSAQEPYVDFVMENVKKVGFDIKDIKYILLSHGHLDHFGGAARIAEASGARVAALDEDWKMIEDFATRPGRNGGPAPRTPKRDMVVKEGDTLTLGGTTIEFYHHPGHTPGVLSGEFTVYDNGVPHKALWQGGGGYRGGLREAEEGLATTRRLAQMPGIEVLVMIHSWAGGANGYPGGGVLERAQLLAKRKPGEPHPFVDPRRVDDVHHGGASQHGEKRRGGKAQGCGGAVVGAVRGGLRRTVTSGPELTAPALASHWPRTRRRRSIDPIARRVAGNSAHICPRYAAQRTEQAAR